MTENVFLNISDSEKEKLLTCLGTMNRSYSKGEIIYRSSDKNDYIGIITSGKAHVTCVDFEGTQSVLETLSESGVFGEMFMLPMDQFGYYVEADSQCMVCFIRSDSITKPCRNACEYHCTFLGNLFAMAAVKARNLSLHINILSRRTTRQKLMAYFETQSILLGTKTFDLPLSLTSLAEYIGSDRSAMMRELKRMREEGAIKGSGRTVTLH